VVGSVKEILATGATGIFIVICIAIWIASPWKLAQHVIEVTEEEGKNEPSSQHPAP